MQSSKFSLTTIPRFIFGHFSQITTGGISLILLLMLMGVWRTGSRLMAGVDAFFHAPPATPQVEVSSLIVQQIRSVSELTTAVFVMESVVPTAQDRTIGNVVIGTTKLLYIARGEVRAGIDLSQLSTNAIAIHDQTIRIQLPPPQIIDSKIDVNRSRVYDYDRGFLNLGPDVAPELQTLAQQATLDKIVTNACREGILKEANDRAATTLTHLLTTAGYRQIEVIPTENTDCHSPIKTS